MLPNSLEEMCSFERLLGGWDWANAFHPDLEPAVSALLNDSDSLKACRDLCDASKHVTPTWKCPLVVHVVTASSTAATSAQYEGAIGTSGQPRYCPPSQPPLRLKFEINGRTIAAEEL